MIKYIIIITISLILVVGEEDSESNIIYSKSIDDSKVIIEMTSKIEHYKATEEEKKNLPNGFIIHEGEYLVKMYVMNIIDNSMKVTEVWKREVKGLNVPPGHGAESKLDIIDVIIEQNIIAILFKRHNRLVVEIVEKNKTGEYTLVSKHTIYEESCFELVKEAKMVCLKDIFIIVMTTTKYKVWQVSQSEVIELEQKK